MTQGCTRFTSLVILREQRGAHLRTVRPEAGRRQRSAGRLGWAGQALPSGCQRPRPPRLVHTPGQLRGPCQGPLGHDLPAWSAGSARRDAAFSGALPVCCAQRLGGRGLRGGRRGPGGCNTHMHQDSPTGSRHGSSTGHHHLSPGHLRKKWKIKKLL